MKNISIDSYEIKTSRTEQKVPVINGVHLHSIYNPYKEAEGLIDKHLDSLKNNSEVLVLGLGFAYHVNELIEKMKTFHGDQFKIIVIEPNITVHDDCISLGLLNKKNVLIYAGFSANELYSDCDLVHFLLKKPTLIAHPPSFNLYQIYFKEFLSFEAPTSIGGAQGFISSYEVKKYLEQFSSEKTLHEILQNISMDKNQFSEMDFLANALFEMTKKSINMNSNKTNGDV